MALLHRSRGCEIREASAEPTGGGRNADGGTNGIGPNHRPPSGPKAVLNGGNATARDGVPNGVGISAEAAATAAGLASLSSLSDDQLPSILDELGKDKASAERSGPSPRQRPVRSVPTFEPHRRPPPHPHPSPSPPPPPPQGLGKRVDNPCDRLRNEFARWEAGSLTRAQVCALAVEIVGGEKLDSAAQAVRVEKADA